MIRMELKNKFISKAIGGNVIFLSEETFEENYLPFFPKVNLYDIRNCRWANWYLSELDKGKTIMNESTGTTFRRMDI